MAAFTHPAAAELWRAREERRTVDPVSSGLGALTPETAAEIADELYRHAFDREPSAWKLGAIDDEAQRRLGLTAPLVAPVLPDRLSLDATEVRLSRSDFVQPRLEPEIGVRIAAAAAHAVACVEIADCRVPQWQLPPAAAIADFGLQGAMVFGPAVEPPEVVRVEVRHDGRVVQTADQSWSSTIERIVLLPPGATRGPVSVATGAMSPLLDALPGRWEFDFGALSTIALVIS